MRNIISAFMVISIFLVIPGYAAEPSIVQSLRDDSNSHTASVHDFNTMPINQLTDRIGMRFFTSQNFTVIQWTLKKGAKLPIHSHLNEQLIRVDSGRLDVDSEGKIYHLDAGQMMVFPAYVTHGFIAMADTVMYEQQTPIRQDFLEPDFIQKLSDFLAKNQLS